MFVTLPASWAATGNVPGGDFNSGLSVDAEGFRKHSHAVDLSLVVETNVELINSCAGGLVPVVSVDW